MLRPSTWKPSLQAAQKLWFNYAHLKSVARNSCVDASDSPVPWYTYPAIEYLKQLAFSDRTIFEYGSGNSTLFWGAVAKRVVSVEDDEEWYGIVSGKLPPNCELILEPDLHAYANTLSRYSEKFDVIVVDGAARGKTRLKCSRVALEHLREGGMIILDNSDWLPESARVLREGGLIQVDMTGFAPISARTQTTSFFLHRHFNFEPKGPRQPMPGPGAAEMIWEQPTPTEPPLVEFGGEVFGGVYRDQPFTIASPEGAKTFRFLAGRSRQSGHDCAALLDVRQQRVLLAIGAPTDGRVSVEAELEAAISMPWNAFVRFVNNHEKRRYRVDANGA